MSSEAATQTASEPKNLADVALKAEIEGWGWKVDGGDKEWFAESDDGTKIGPSTTIKALHTQVSLAAGPKKQRIVKAPRKGKTAQPMLPETKAAALEALPTAILAYRATTMEILELQKRQETEKKLVMGLMHRYEDALETDDETGFKFFDASGIIAELVIEEKEVLKTRERKD